MSAIALPIRRRPERASLLFIGLARQAAVNRTLLKEIVQSAGGFHEVQ
ncbi:hypothetical protein CAter282_1726 [Collimonas arenae]|uniref:Uncharacterized protein n=1 Tax=Collimonas arenae TaxID=279058 RepID=A0A127PP87_9BURK|nr:hypothetical protein CAter10_1859 [Collimonas arenae]AMP09507.1 hypothetical protein CAter282_1726 [Collimonas arenae]